MMTLRVWTTSLALHWRQGVPRPGEAVLKLRLALCLVIIARVGQWAAREGQVCLDLHLPPDNL